MQIIRALYDWALAESKTKKATISLCLVSFIESSVFPIPPDLMLIPMCLSQRKKAFYYALLCTIFSVLGAFLGYAIGSLLFNEVAFPLLKFYGMAGSIPTFQANYTKWGMWIVIFAGFTPFPYKVITITSGMMHLNLIIFTVASIISRGGRFFLVAGLIKLFGKSMQDFIEKYLTWLTFALFLVIFLSFSAIKLFI